MATPSYSGVRARFAYSETAGLRLLSLLDGAGSDPFIAAWGVKEGTSLGLSRTHVIKLLHLLAASGWITRIKKGVYAINDPVTRQPKAHPFAIGTALVSPSAISHWSALQHWGLTEQIPTTITLSSPQRTFPRSAESPSGHAAWMVAGVRYEVITVTRERFFGVTQVWISERNQVPIFDRERALLDVFHHFRTFGSLSTALEILEAHLEEIDLDRLVQYATQLHVGAVVKRVGWSLERLDVAPDKLEPLRSYPVTGSSPLDPGRPARGHHNATWHIIENLNDGK